MHPQDDEEAAFLDNTFEGQSYTTHVIPDDLCGRDERELWDRMVSRVVLGLPPANAADALLRATMQALPTLKGCKAVTPDMVVTAVRLVIAEAHGVRIRTHARDIAAHHGIRYQTFLKLRALARKQLAQHQVRLDLPEWLKLDFSP